MKDRPVGKLEREEGTFRLVMEREFAVPMGEVWRALTEPQKLALWLGAVVNDARVGGSFRIDFDGEEQAGGRILRYEPPRVLQFEWGEPGVSSSVLIELDEAAAGTRLRLVHARQSAGLARNTGAGWHAHLDLLEASLLGKKVTWEEVYAQALPRYENSLRT